MPTTLAARFDALLRLCRDDPGRPAIIGLRETLSFGVMLARAGGILAALDGAPAGMVLIHGHKEPDIVPAMIAATLAGRGFVFADISYPSARVAQIAALCQCSVALRTDPAAVPSGLPTIDTGAVVDARSCDAWLDPAKEETLFYVTFTSGSTGVPKGIPTTRASYAALADWFEPANTRSKGGAHAHVSHASMAFDMSMSDIWTALFAGRAVFLLDHRHTLSPRANIRHMTRAADVLAGTLTATPAFFSLMLEDPQFSAARLPGLQAFWIGGEAVPRVLLRRLRDRFPGCEIHHAYGPSECACITHAHVLSDADLAGEGALPLGPAHSGARVMVDTGDGLRSTGTGEIVLVGPQVGRCYWPLSHPNNASFGAVGSERSYRTGDRGAVDAEGTLWIHGRIDAQVKVNGFRIELTEIEARAVEVAGVAQAVAMQDAGRGLLLVLSATPGAAVPLARVRAHLRASLPPFMVPGRILVETALPMSHAGKIDRRAMQDRLVPA